MERAATVGVPPNEILREMYSTGRVMDAHGKSVRLHSQVSALSAAALYRLVLEQRPQLVVEIGMAYGGATLSILTGLKEAGTGGRLISVDPAQTSGWKGIGLANVARAGFDAMHTLVEAPSYQALPSLLAQGTRVDFAYVDGWHTFDYTLLDFFYLDKMLPVGGIVGFNDCGRTSVWRVLNFIRSHRKYRPLDVGLPKAYAGRNLLFALGRRLLGRGTEDRYFQKTEDWEPPWSFYAPF